jgi:ubiquinone/menaquinone biosynthesis C-methylase UbiE
VKAEEIRDFWAEQARAHGESPSASWSDHRVIELEIAAIGARLQPGERVLDVGCANGYSSARYAALGATVVGVDYIPEMVENAESRRRTLPEDVVAKLEFGVGDVMTLDFADASFDAVVSTRVIINLPSWEEQLQGLHECVRVLRPGGRLLLSEATEQGWRRLNALRGEWGLPDIPMPCFNRYVLTRLVKPLLAASANAAVDVANPDAEFNRWAGALPAGGDYGTQKLFVLRRR